MLKQNQMFFWECSRLIKLEQTQHCAMCRNELVSKTRQRRQCLEAVSACIFDFIYVLAYICRSVNNLPNQDKDGTTWSISTLSSTSESPNAHQNKTGKETRYECSNHHSYSFVFIKIKETHQNKAKQETRYEGGQPK